MSTPDRTPEGWSRVARQYDAGIAPLLARIAEDVLDRTKLRAGERVLDVAAGTGALSLAAARRGASVLATDFAPGMVELLRERAHDAKVEIRAEVMDGQALDVPPASFDAAYSNFGLIFFPDRAAGFRGMKRALKPGGRAVVTSWSANDRTDWFVAFDAALRAVVPDMPPPPAPPAIFSLADPARFRKEMEDAGFRHVRVETVRYPWDNPSPEAGVTAFLDSNPVVPGLLGSLDAATVKAFRAKLHEQYLRHRTPEGGVRLWGEAHVGVGEP